MRSEGQEPYLSKLKASEGNYDYEVAVSKEKNTVETIELQEQTPTFRPFSRQTLLFSATACKMASTSSKEKSKKGKNEIKSRNDELPDHINKLLQVTNQFTIKLL